MFSSLKRIMERLEAAKVVSIFGNLYCIVYIYNSDFWSCLWNISAQGSLILRLLNHKAAAPIRNTLI